MISISCDHPDLEEFIEIKSNLDKVTKANISVRVSDKFMKSVINAETLILKESPDHHSCQRNTGTVGTVRQYAHQDVYKRQH